MKCLVDGSDHDNTASLNAHLRKLGYKQERYYKEFYNKKDLYTGQDIEYKNPERYLATDFNTKINIRRFIKDKPVEAKAWAINWLKKRKEEKGLVFAPTQVELRSLQCPSVKYYDSVGGYDSICKELGFLIRFTGKYIGKKLPEDAVIIQDTREQMPLKLLIKTKIEKLNVGDYGLDKPHDTGNYIERKSLADFVGTLTSKKGKEGSEAKFGFDRFRAELLRARESNSYLVMIVENDINDALGFKYLPQMKFTRSSPDHVFKNLRDLLVEFTNFQALFVKGRKESADIMVKLLGIGNHIKNVDLQYAYENGELN